LEGKNIIFYGEILESQEKSYYLKESDHLVILAEKEKKVDSRGSFLEGELYISIITSYN